MPSPPYQPVPGDVLDQAGVVSNRDAAVGWHQDVTPADISVTHTKIFPPFVFGYPVGGKDGVVRSVYGRQPPQDAALMSEKSRRVDMFSTEYVARADGLMVVPSLAWSGYAREGDEAVLRAWFSHQHFVNAEYEDELLGNHMILASQRSRPESDAVLVPGSEVPTYGVTSTIARVPAAFPQGSLFNLSTTFKFPRAGVWDIAVVFRPNAGHTPYQHVYGRGALSVLMSRTSRPVPTGA